MSTKTPLVSIIVPIYNTELSLQSCLSSIASQTYKNIEVIMINDGSTDNSGNIAKLFCDNDSRFQLVNQPNSGVAAARNTALRLIQGDFIIHVDSDDLVLEKAYEIMVKAAEKHNADIVVSSYLVGTKDQFSQKTINPEVINIQKFIDSLLCGQAHGGLWNKLVSRRMYENIKFNENINYMEDLLFFIEVLNNKNPKIVTVSEPSYFYFFRENSLSNQAFDNNIEHVFLVIDEIEKILDTQYVPSINKLKMNQKIQFISDEYNKKYKFSDIYPELNSSILRSEIPLRYKALMFFEIINVKFITKSYHKMRGWKE